MVQRALEAGAIGNSPKTESGSLTMLKFPGDEFVSLELVHDSAWGEVDGHRGEHGSGAAPAPLQDREPRMFAGSR
jgi:hypothetical protein